MQACLARVQAEGGGTNGLGVVQERILEFRPVWEEVVVAFVHIFMGIFNKIKFYEHIKKQLLVLFDEPHMRRSAEAIAMEGRVTELDSKQKEHAEMIVELKDRVSQLQGEKAALEAYIPKKIAKRLKTKLSGEMRHVDQQIAAVNKQI